MSQFNYSFDELDARATAARYEYAEHIESMERSYQQQRRSHTQIAIVGPGRSGKDTAAEFLAAKFGFPPVVSASLIVCPLITHMLGGSPCDCTAVYEERHQHRDYWIEACHAIRRKDLTCMTRWSFGMSPFSVGIRGKEEFAESVAKDVVELSVWIDRDVPPDPTLEFTRDQCDVIIENHTSIERFQERLTRFGRAFC